LTVPAFVVKKHSASHSVLRLSGLCLVFVVHLLRLPMSCIRWLQCTPTCVRSSTHDAV